ncbi:MAG: GNAT family N-acetyltransferase [Polaribacter sp.]|nr:GNAT family N-acetyltransferase [Polaribacter sp.]MDG1811794.1 GNAT family N-acetyltransferase [Polaribacter sp.]MDG1994661.1 GNAT family N-acetyltransferase [Polaribacter sp.]
MSFRKNQYTSLFFSSITAVTGTIWSQLGCSKNIYFHPNYLLSLEKNNPQIKFSYLVLLDSEKKPVAFASIQTIDFPLDGIENSIKQNFHLLKYFGRRLGVFPKLKPIKLMVCGNVFVSGEHGVFIKENENKHTVLKKVVKAISKETASEDISIYLIKDFIKESLNITNKLLHLNYYSFNVETNMQLILDEKWLCFDDYLAAMKTKFRVKAKRALTLSKSLVVKDNSEESIKEIIPEITKLYKTVSNKAVFNLGDFNPETYSSLKNQLGENYFLKSYEHEGKVVGFMSGIINNTSLDAHFVGIDYSLNKQKAIYQRMLYDYIEIAISKKLKTINFGRTASEIKSSVGATPQELTCYIRHKKTIKNKFIKYFLSYIETKPFKQQKPFK